MDGDPIGVGCIVQIDHCRHLRGLHPEVDHQQVESWLCVMDVVEQARELVLGVSVPDRYRGLAEVTGKPETVLVGESLDDRPQLRGRNRSQHVVVQIVDAEPGLEGPFDLGTQLHLDLGQIRIGGRELGLRSVEVAVGVDQRRYLRRPEHRSPLVVLPLGVEGEVDADADLRVGLQNLNRLQVPGAGDHHRGGERKTTRDKLSDCHVDGVRHADVVAPYEELFWLIVVIGIGNCRGYQQCSEHQHGRDHNEWRNQMMGGHL